MTPRRLLLLLLLLLIIIIMIMIIIIIMIIMIMMIMMIMINVIVLRTTPRQSSWRWTPRPRPGEAALPSKGVTLVPIAFLKLFVQMLINRCFCGSRRLDRRASAPLRPASPRSARHRPLLPPPFPALPCPPLHFPSPLLLRIHGGFLIALSWTQASSASRASR